MGVRVAIPLFGAEVAPRFCFTTRMLIVDLDEGQVQQREVVEVHDLDWAERLNLLAHRRVQVLICGGFNRRFLSYALELGLEVIWGRVGPVDGLLSALVNSKDLWQRSRRCRGKRAKEFSR